MKAHVARPKKTKEQLRAELIKAKEEEWEQQQKENKE